MIRKRLRAEALLIVPLLLAGFALLTTAPGAAAAPGDRDRGFGRGGSTEIAVSNTEGELARSSAIQPDGGILVAGTTLPAGTGLLARYLPDGRLDPSFGTAGVVETPARVWDSVAVQPDGKILLAGRSGRLAAISRLLPDGSPDPSFAGDGAWAESVEWRDPGEAKAPLLPHLTSLVTTADGSVMAGGMALDCRRRRTCGAALSIRLGADGTPAADYGNGQGVLIDVDTWLNTVGVLPSGNMITVSTGEEPTVDEGYEPTNVIVQHPSRHVETTPGEPREASDDSWEQTLNRNGAYGGSGVLGSNTGAVVPSPDGDAMFIGSGSLLIRINDEGFTTGAKFGENAQVELSAETLGLNIRKKSLSIGGIAFDGDKLIVTGRSVIGKTAGAFILRLNADGSPDPTFDNDGIATLWPHRTTTLPAVGINPLPRVLIRDGGYAVTGITTDGAMRTRFGVAAFQGGSAPVPRCGGQAATYIGDDRDEFIKLPAGVIYAGGGDDGITLEGAGSRSIVCAGPGNDRVTVGGGTVFGGPGDDRIKSLPGTKRARLRYEETFDGGPGNDVLLGLAGDDSLRGGPGVDRLVGGTQNDSLLGGAGRDRLSGGRGIDRLIGGGGHDELDGGPTASAGPTYVSDGDRTTVTLVPEGDAIVRTTVETPFYCSQINPGSTGGSRLVTTIRKKLRFRGKQDRLRHHVYYSDDWSALDEALIARRSGRVITGRYKQTVPSPWWAQCWTGESMKDPWVEFRATLRPPVRQIVRQ